MRLNKKYRDIYNNIRVQNNTNENLIMLVSVESIYRTKNAGIIQHTISHLKIQPRSGVFMK
jgi:hypothetical protein